MSTSPSRASGKEHVNPDTAPTSPKPTVTSPKPKKRRLEPPNDAIVYNEDIHIRSTGDFHGWEWYPDLIRSWVRRERVPAPYAPNTSQTSATLPPLQYPLDQVLAAFVATMDRELRHMRDAAGEITGMLEREKNLKEEVEELTDSLSDTDTLHGQLVDKVQTLEARMTGLEANVAAANARAEAAEQRAEATEQRAEAAEQRAEAVEALAAQAMGVIEPVSESEEKEEEEEPEEEEDEDSVISSARSAV